MDREENGNPKLNVKPNKVNNTTNASFINFQHS